MTAQITSLARDLEGQLVQSLITLESDICRVEQELDLELENLGDLLDRHHPDVNRQLTALNGSIRQLHTNLNSVRQHLSTAQRESTQIYDLSQVARARFTPHGTAHPPQDPHPHLSSETAESLRHSSPVTLGSIVRALLMAEEPAQRPHP